jgi:hypothetical protein
MKLTPAQLEQFGRGACLPRNGISALGKAA